MTSANSTKDSGLSSYEGPPSDHTKDRPLTNSANSEQGFAMFQTIVSRGFNACGFEFGGCRRRVEGLVGQTL